MILTVLSLSFTAFASGYLISQKNFSKNTASISTEGVLNKFNNENPVPAESLAFPEKFKTLSPRNVLSPTISKEKDSIIFYEKSTGKVFEITLSDLKEKVISETLLANLTATMWSPNKKEVISTFYHPNGAQYKYFNYKTRKSVDLGNDIKSLSFSPNGNQIIYFGTKDDSAGIFISTPDGNSFKKLISSRLEEIEVYWPLEETMFFKTETENSSELYSLSKTGEVKKIISSDKALDIKFSKDGSRILFSKKDSSGFDLFYKEITSETEINLQVATSASKCDWETGNQSIVCGIPKSSNLGDEIYEIKTDGTKNLLSSPEFRINTAELFISNTDIVILNSINNKLYSLKRSAP